MTGDERVRLFCGLCLDEEAAEALAGWIAEQPPGAYRAVPPASLHVTLAFLGHRLVGEIDAIARELRAAAAAARPVELRPLRYRETRSVGMLVCEDVEGAGAELAAELQRRLAALGVYEPEQRRWLPHVTVLRFRGGPPRLRPGLPNVRSLRVVRSALYRSLLRAGGAQYEIVESARLGG